MADPIHSIRFPNESEAYRSARDELLRAEMDLRAKIESVAALRRSLPKGGAAKEDYRFEEIVAGERRTVRLSELFSPGKTSLVLYGFMFGPEMERACPMCTSFLDGADGAVPHLERRIDFAVIAKSPIERIRAFADERGWSRLRLLSSAGTTFGADYHTESPSGAELPVYHVFRKTDDGIVHSWASEMLFAPSPWHARHVDLLWPIWSFFDLTPEGRGDFLPKLRYEP
jgi:predicted dithiol-disulfide oxidoreductase (DUF899 family)